MNKYLDFRERVLPGGKTAIVDVRSASSGITLGVIRWYPPWRQYCFYPENLMVFNHGCLTSIVERIKAMMEAHKIKEG